VSTLHITNGDHAGDKLKTILDGRVITAADVLHEGPCPPVDGDAWYEARARFLAGGYGAPYEETKKSLRATDETIADACARGATASARGTTASARGATASAERQDITLWFEHDLFDQLLIVRTLDLIARAKTDATNVALICIGAFPGIDRFVGLGQLTPDQLATLKNTGSPVTAGHYALATDAWRAFRSPDPRDLVTIAQQLTADAVGGAEGTPALVFLGDALLRFLAEYPSTTNGLMRTEQLALETLAGGAADAGSLFAATQARETRPFMGDTTFFDIVGRMASARVPLVTIESDASASPRHRRVAIADAGRDVLAGRADHVRLNGIDLWRGGTRLTGSDRSPWRWDADAETLVS
jgi:hypothetical protein